MIDPQAWTLIAVFASAMAAVIGLVIRTVTAEIAAGFATMGREMDQRFGGIDQRFGQIDQRFGEVNSRLDTLTGKVDNLDRDVQFLMRREFGES